VTYQIQSFADKCADSRKTISGRQARGRHLAQITFTTVSPKRDLRYYGVSTSKPREPPASCLPNF
jgi:hypothetical protein